MNTLRVRCSLEGAAVGGSCGGEARYMLFKRSVCFHFICD